MREIEFRAWDDVLSKMIYSTIEQFDDSWMFRFDEHFETETPIYLQYTGSKDKNSVKIYEGDIVKQTYHAERGSVHDGTEISFDGHHIGAVVITASQGVCMRKPLCWSMETDETITTNQYKKVAGYRSEVIGNIYQNPELLREVS